jgi:adenylate kinase family enzyme
MADLQDFLQFDLTRTLIFGNGGSGKTWLATHLGNHLRRDAIHFDELRWQPGNFGIARDNQLVVNDVSAAAEAEQWLMEGVYGWLAKVVLPRATALIWIDLPEAECVANVRARGIQGGGSQAAFDELITWISEYRLRTNSSCFAAHAQLYEEFAGYKTRLTSRDQIASFLTGLVASPLSRA